MAEIVKLFDELKPDYNEAKEHPEKFLAALTVAYPENKKTLSDALIKLKPSQWSVLAIEPEILQKTILRAQELGFIEAYQQNAAYLKQDVDKVIKRISESEARGIPYKNENGKYKGFLFSERGYAYVINQSLEQNPTPIVQENSKDNLGLEELREYADRVMETFSLTSEKEQIYQKLEALANSGLSMKEALLEAFKSYGDNLEYLGSVIDEILALNAEVEMGRVA